MAANLDFHAVLVRKTLSRQRRLDVSLRFFRDRLISCPIGLGVASSCGRCLLFDLLLGRVSLSLLRSGVDSFLQLSKVRRDWQVAAGRPPLVLLVRINDGRGLNRLQVLVDQRSLLVVDQGARSAVAVALQYLVMAGYCRYPFLAAHRVLYVDGGLRCRCQDRLSGLPLVLCSLSRGHLG